MSYVDGPAPKASVGLRIFIGISAAWILVAGWAYIAFGLMGVGMCHSGCGDTQAKALALFGAALATLAASIWIVVQAFKGRISSTLAWAVAATDLLLWMVPIIFWSQMEYG